MFDLIHKLRQKNDRTKTFIAFSASLFFAGTIFLVWMTVVLPDVRQDKKVKDKIASIEPSPFSSFFNNIAQGFSGIKGQFSNIKEKVSELSANVINADSTMVNATSTFVTEDTDTLILIDESLTATSTVSATTTTKIGE